MLHTQGAVLLDLLTKPIKVFFVNILTYHLWIPMILLFLSLLQSLVSFTVHSFESIILLSWQKTLNIFIPQCFAHLFLK